MAKTKSKKTYKIVYTRGQKIKGWVALTLLFICGVMVGVGLSGKNTVVNNNSVRTQQKETCSVIEEIQLNYLADESSSYVDDHKQNIRIYETLFMHGCPENKDTYRAAIAREMEIVSALSSSAKTEEVSACKRIEDSLLERLPVDHSGASASQRIVRAKIYANLSERGCQENAQRYVELARQELEIARALEDDQFDNKETIDVVETYKRIHMQAAAEEIFETAKKLTNPAIDFILQVEKIINEQ